MYNKELAEMVLGIRDKIVKDPNAAQKVLDAVLIMGPSAFFDNFPNEEQARGAIETLKWIEDHLDYVPTEDQVDDVRAVVDQLTKEGKVHKDSEGKIWPKGHPNFREPLQH